MVIFAALNTYKQNFNVMALERLEKVCHPRLHPSPNEDPFIHVIQEDGSESIYITWQKIGKHI